MSTHEIPLNVVSRGNGKSIVRGLRKNKITPAVIYGEKSDNFSLAVDEKFIVKYTSSSKYENAIFDFKSEDSNLNGKKALIKDVVTHPVTRRPVHVDFLAIDLLKDVTVNIEFKFTGKPEGAQEGGQLQVVLREIEVTCLPKNIPDFIEVKVDHLKIGDSIHLEDITLPSDVKLTTHENLTLCTCATIKEEVIETPVVAEGAEGAEGAEAAAGSEAAPAGDAGGEKKD